MAKKEIEVVKKYDDYTRTKVYHDAFLEALDRDGLSVHGDKLHIETRNRIYIVDLGHFSFAWNESFEKIFGNDLPQGLKIENLSPEIMRLICEWINPVFDQMPMEIKAREKLLREFTEKLKKDEEYYKAVRYATLELLDISSLEKRKAYLDRFMPFGIVTEKDKVEFEYYSDYTPEMLEKLFQEQEMEADEKREVVSQAFAHERKKQETSEKNAKKGSNRKIVQLMNLLPVNEILEVFLADLLTIEEFTKTKVTKKDILNLPYEMLLEILINKNDVLPENLRIKSKDIVNQYGRTLNGSDIYQLSQDGYIEPQDLIEVYEINKALKSIAYEEEMLEEEELRAYYTPAILMKMREMKTLTPRFLEKLLELQDFENQPELFRMKSKMLVEELKRVAEEKGEVVFTDEVLYYFDSGLCDVYTARESVSEEDIELKFMNDELSIEKIFAYYRKGLISDEAISKYYSNEEILALYQEGKLNGTCLKAIKDADMLVQAFCDGEIREEDFVRLYIETDTLLVTDFDTGIQIAEKEVDIASFIDEKTPFSKIKELFSNYLVDYASLLRMHHQGIIDDKQLEELKTTVSTKEFFQELETGRTYKVVTTREGEFSPRRRVIPDAPVERDFSDEMELISRLLERDVEEETYSLIESYNAKGRATSLNLYRIFGNEELDGIIILQKSKKENAVYVMNALQMMYFLKGKENETGQIEIQDRMKDKAYLKTIEGVEVVEHTEHFVRNLVEAAAKVSPKIAQRVRTEDGEYVQEVDRMVTTMREKYLEVKAKGRDEE